MAHQSARGSRRRPRASRAPKEISHYKLLKRLGSGGMGDVYLALDQRLDRKVALKLLKGGAGPDAQAAKRLRREATAAAALDHPNICAVYDVARHGEQTYIAMQYIEGESLQARIARGRLPTREALALAIQLADALAEAHQHGIVHRDVKPGNVMITARGEAKLLDFGLARRQVSDLDALTRAETRSQLTVPGAFVGTLSYMSPEQARGGAVDGRTDVFSLGIVLYEMVTGVQPFDAGSAAEILSAILVSPPPPLVRHVDSAPAGLQRVLDRALAKEKSERYQSARELQADLRALETALATGTAPPEPRRGRAPAIAVLPFVDMGTDRDQGFFCEGIADEVINALSRVEGLRVAGRSSSFELAQRTRDPRRVGEALGVSAVLDGSVRRSGDRFRISAHLVNVADGFDLWSERYDRQLADIFEIQDEIARAIAGALEIRLRTGQHRLVRSGTQNMVAYQLYLKGVYHLNRRLPEEVQKAKAFFEQALEADSSYALPYAGLAACYVVPGYYGVAPPGVVMPLGKAAALKALELDDTVADAHASLALVNAVYDFEWSEAERRFQRALELNPASSTAQMWYALFHLAPTRRLDDALRIARRAEELDPLNPSTSAIVAATLYYRREFDAALAELERTLALQPRFPIAHYYRARALAAREEFADATAAIEEFHSLMGGGSATGFLSYCLAAQGRRADAERALEQLRQRGERRYTPAHSFAEAYLGLGDHERAFEALERARDERSAAAIWLASDRIYDPLRSEPRFAALLRGFNLA
jgi:serine/threonine protein kinase/tetratricopeptide (TPR) repeat protein